MITRLFLVLTALMYLAFGVWSISDPLAMTAQLGVIVSGVSGVFEMRGIFGGVSLGAAILCAIGALFARFRVAALCFIAAYMGGYVMGRGASFIVGDTAASSNWFFAGYEAVMFVIAVILILRQE